MKTGLSAALDILSRNTAPHPPHPPFIVDGTILAENLRTSGRSRLWLEQQLAYRHISLFSVFLAIEEDELKFVLYDAPLCTKKPCNGEKISL